CHPFENPTAFTNFLELFAIVLIPASLVFMYGEMARARKHAWLLYFVMLFLLIAGLSVSIYSENLPNPVLGVSPSLEGKETRLGITNSVLWSVATTATANGSVNCMLSSLSPLAGGICMLNIMIGELIFGGVGVGLASMIFFVLLAVFLSGLMVGRTPEYLGKKIEWRDIQWVIVAVLTPEALILIGSSLASGLQVALSSLSNHGPHGLSEILYAFTSASGNNGSAFAGLNVNTTFYNVVLGCVMLTARTAIILPSLALGGLLAKKKITPSSLGTFSTDTFLFALLLLFSILIIVAITYFPALVLGPIVEHFLMLGGKSFS
ncbi:MAG TPA: potassium-transporting ATPase subunit KdpA, partial [Chlamydiales bacterium]|nr:potassium-transporting ATPase subunit KdpA [Chlamydiales bacterium]